MAENFDPYVEWLGLRETARPLSHYQLLGVPEFEDNPLAIAVAADASIARLRNCNPGDRVGRLQQLLDELTLAKLCLADRARKQQYDSALRERRGTTPAGQRQSTPLVTNPFVPRPIDSSPIASGPTIVDLFPPNYRLTVESRPTEAVPTTVAVAQADAPQRAPLASPVLQTAPAASPAQVNAPPVYAGVPTSPPVRIPMAYPVMVATPHLAPVVPVLVARPVAPSSPLAPVSVVPLARPAEPVVAIPTYAVEPTSDDAKDYTQPGSVEPVVPHLEESTSRVPFDFGAASSASSSAARRTSWSPDVKSIGAFASVALVALLAFVFMRGGETSPLETAENTPPPVMPTDSPKHELPAREPRLPSKVERPKLESEPVQPASDPVQPVTQPEEPKPEPVPEIVQVDEPATPEPKPEPTPEPAPQSEQSPDQKAAFEQAVKSARAAMAGRKLDRAKQELQTAKTNAGTKQQEDQLVRLEQLHGYVDGFWKAVVDALKGLQATDTLAIDNTEIAIVEVDERSITIRAAGKNLSYTLENMPAGLAVALATRWFDMKVPANKLFLGAFHAVDPKGDLEEARRLWQQATQGGASAEDLMPLLDDRPGSLSTEQGPVPDKAAIAQKNRELRSTMAGQFRAANTLERKLSLARELLDAADESSDNVERYVLYEAALQLAAESGSAADINRAIDGMAAGFKVNAWYLRAKFFTDAAQTADNPVIAKTLARAMLEVVDKAIAENRAIEANKLCTAALVAAKKGKDLELVKQANERKLKLGGE